MIISNSHKFIFVHVMKTAGTSVSAALDPWLRWNDIAIGGTRFGEQIQPARAEPRVSDILAAHRSGARPRMRAARRDRRRGRLDGDAEHPGLLAARGDREGHGEGSGITAVASISTSHSGRASATTTRPVQTG